MAIMGNKGEWSEIYAFLRLLADGKIFAADESLNKIDTMFFPIIKIIREETIGKQKEYYTGRNIRVCIDGETIEIPAERFSEEAEFLLQQIQNSRGATLSSEKTEDFMKVISVERLESRGRDKADIFIQIHDFQTGYETEVGFSIKSKLGKPATLLNASGATNFTYEVIGDADKLDYVRNNLVIIQGVEKPDSKNKAHGIKEILTNLDSLDCKIKFLKTDERFNDNLMMTDSQMSVIIAEMLKVYHSGKVSNTLENIIGQVVAENPLALKSDKAELFYTHKVKALLCDIALGMLPSVEWNGTDEATGGYIIVKSDGDVVAYHIYNRDKFKSYLLSNTRFESASRSRHNFGYIFENDGKLCININLQIRFR